MAEGLLAVRLLLAAVFGVAGVGKMLDQAGERDGLREFGLPGWLARPLAFGLPLGELAVAAGLVPLASARWAALAGLGLLGVFVAAIAVNLARGRRPDCHCFGQLHSTPIGWSTVARNGALAGLAGLVAWQGPGLDAGSMAGLPPSGWLALSLGIPALGALLVQGWFVLNLTAQQGRLLLRLEALEAVAGPAPSPAAVQLGPGLPVGSPAPDFLLSGLWGETLTLPALLASGQPLLLVFTDPGCGPCNALMPELGRWQREQASALTVAVVSRGDRVANRAKAREHGLTHVLLQHDHEVATAYRYAGTPGAVLVGADGLIASPLAAGADAIRALVARRVGGTALRPVGAEPPLLAPSGRNGTHAPPVGSAVPPPIGGQAPTLALPDLDGNTVDLRHLRGQPTLLLFWNPGCGFCQQMLEQLRAWEQSPPPQAPRLVLVSSGSAEANRALGLCSLVLLDAEGAALRAFGASGTPMAVLLDAEGRVASSLAAGAREVMGLARGQAQLVGDANGVRAD